MGRPSRIYHIALRAAWARACETGHYIATSLPREGFIHCSEARQIPGVARRWFGQDDDVVLLVIDVDRVSAAVRWDPVGDDAFPHVYGPLAVGAVIDVVDPFDVTVWEATL